MSAASAPSRPTTLIAAIAACLGMCASSAAAATPNSWRPAAPVPNAHYVAGEAALSGDRVLLAGGQDAQGNELKSATIYNAATDTWTAAADMGTIRIVPSAVTLPDGTVLVAGGGDPTGGSNALATAEVYDPVANSWAPTTNTMSSGRGDNPMTVLLPNGKVLIAGGYDQNTHALATADIYDPGTKTFTPTGSMGTARDLAAAVLLPNGKVLVAGGVTTGFVTTPTAELYDPGTGTWAPVANTMSADRAYMGAALLPNGKVLLEGGESFTTFSTTDVTDIYDPATNRFTPGPAMGVQRAGFGSASLPGGQALIFGGFSIAEHVQGLNPTAQLFNPSTNTWTTVAPPPLPKELGTSVRLSDGDVLWAGGFAGETTSLNDAELYTPPVSPGPPASVSATAGDRSATVVFAAPATDGGLPVMHYTVTASTGQTATTPDARTYATVSGLTNGKPVTFTVTATTGFGTSAASAPSRATTPTAPPAPPVTPPAPKLTLTGLQTKLKLASFLQGVRFTVASNQAVSLSASLLGSLNRATIARAYQLVLGSKSLGRSRQRRTLTVVPGKKLVGRPRKATVQLRIVATNAGGRQSTVTKQLTVTR